MKADEQAARLRRPGAVGGSYGHLPLFFERNEGQTDERVRFLSRGSGYTLFITREEAVLALHRGGEENSPSKPGAAPHGSVTPCKLSGTPGAVLRMKIVGANPHARIRGLGELRGTASYFLGNDTAKWHTRVALYDRVRLEAVYPGIDLVYHGNQSSLEYDFVVAAGADPTAIRLDFDGSNRVDISALGELLIRVPGGLVEQHAPVIYQEISGERRRVDGRFVLVAERGSEHPDSAAIVTFEIGAYDPLRPLIIDPVLSYSTYLGGSGGDVGYGIASDSLGNAYVTGETASTDFPTTSPSQSTKGGGVDVFVTKIDVAGALVYSTYLGGSDDDYGHSIAVDASGNAYVAGATHSGDFPIANPYQRTLKGSTDGADAFVAKLDAAGSALTYSTFLGGSSYDSTSGIVVGGSGTAYVTGSTFSTDFPVVSPTQGNNSGGEDAFLARLSPEGSALWYSSYLGGSDDDWGNAIGVDGSGGVYVVGITLSTDFPAVSPYQATLGGALDAFVTKLILNGPTVAYSTYLGGSDYDWGDDIAVDRDGNAYVTGRTSSENFPMENPFQGTRTGLRIAFVTKLNAEGSALVYSTYLGGEMGSDGYAIAVDASGNAYVAGETSSWDFPTVGPIQATYGGGVSDAFLTKLDAMGSALLYSTYLGGSSAESARSIAIDRSGNVLVTGETESGNFPTASPYQAQHGGGRDGFVAKIGLVPVPTSGGIGLALLLTALGHRMLSVSTRGRQRPWSLPLRAYPPAMS
ncbi:MAG: SBBP repeat-containing protein [Candidatus Schekmanbacteria bacterium]|nr:SBBP repeat-containing protein [Candidatus Schekmanbacteria bacterium]